uniref:DNA primase (EC) n=1 Tax=Ganoderma boninense TaxID=34458 RepID=A0A5K1K4F6_9APHY|nr:DNA primase (EC [Ganoderma boninense]
MALAGPSGILDAAPCADVPSCDQPVGAGAAAGEHTWCTPAFYDELCKIAGALVAQSQPAPSTSNASEEVAQDGPCIDEAPPEAISPSPEAPRRRASSKRTRAGSRKARNRGHRTEGSSGEKFLCPLADSNGVCHSKVGLDSGSSEAPRKIKASAYWNGAIQKPRPPKLSAFGRAADLERHILSVHLNVHVRCRRCDDAGKLTQFARYDGFLRHLRGTCFGEEDFDIGREASRQFAFISMPCYRDPGGLFVKALSALRKTRTALSLENSLREKYTKDVRRCDCCRNLDDEEMEAIKPPHLAMGDSYVQCTPNRAFEVSDEARLPPEAEEGVEEEPVAEPGEAPNLDVPTPGFSGFPGLEERESQESRSVHVVAVPADPNSTVQVTGSENTSHEPAALILDQLPELFQPWEIDFELEVDPEALVSDTTWTQWMSPNSS